MKEMFYGAKSLTGLQGDLGDWVTSSLKTMSGIFYETPYRGSIKWDLSRVTDMSYAFALSDYGGDGVDNWNVSQVEDFSFACTFSVALINMAISPRIG